MMMTVFRLVEDLVLNSVYNLSAHKLCSRCSYYKTLQGSWKSSVCAYSCARTSNSSFRFSLVHEIYSVKPTVMTENTPEKSVKCMTTTTNFSQTIQWWQSSTKPCWSCSGTNSKVTCSVILILWLKCLLKVFCWLLLFTLSNHTSCKWMWILCVCVYHNGSN